MTLLAAALAFLSAATFAVSTSLQQKAAEGAPETAHGIVGLISYLLTRPLWLVGQVVALSAFVFHGLALLYGPIAVVQPIVISGIVFAVPVRAAISRRLPSLPELRAVGITATGLAVFLVASSPTEGRPASQGLGTIGLVLAGVVVALGFELAAARVHDDPRRKAFFLGCVGGVHFGIVAGLLKMSLQELDRSGPDGVLTSWPAYALLAAGAAGVLTNQRAYRVAGLSASMPALNIVNGVVALGFGFTVFSEVPRHSPLFLVIEVGSAAAMCVGLWLLIQLEEAQGKTAATQSAQPAPQPG